MIPLVDTHCHLLAGVDDGPRSDADALAMCRIAYAEGTRTICATAHQNHRWAAVTPERIRDATRRLAEQLREANVPLAVVPCAEVMVHPDLERCWAEGRHLSVADGGKYLLLEMPHGLVVDLRDTVASLVRSGVRPILAHPERSPELLHEPERVEQLAAAGCLLQVSSGSVTDLEDRHDRQQLRDWFRRGLAHLVGSDGHSPRRRAPRLREAYREVVRWAGVTVADRVFSTNGTAVCHGLPLHLPEPLPRRPSWFRLW
jgi:protein-tyrosine phosphatase